MGRENGVLICQMRIQGNHKSKIKVSGRLIPPEAGREGSILDCSPGLVDGCLLASIYIILPLYVSASSVPPLNKDISHTGVRAHTTPVSPHLSTSAMALFLNKFIVGQLYIFKLRNSQ